MFLQFSNTEIHLELTKIILLLCGGFFINLSIYGQSNLTDHDEDGDGILTLVECFPLDNGFLIGCVDTDNDSIPDFMDSDSDNDGILDTDECANNSFIMNGSFEANLMGLTDPNGNWMLTRGDPSIVQIDTFVVPATLADDPDTTYTGSPGRYFHVDVPTNPDSLVEICQNFTLTSETTILYGATMAASKSGTNEGKLKIKDRNNSSMTVDSIDFMIMPISAGWMYRQDTITLPAGDYQICATLKNMNIDNIIAISACPDLDRDGIVDFRDNICGRPRNLSLGIDFVTTPTCTMTNTPADSNAQISILASFDSLSIDSFTWCLITDPGNDAIVRSDAAVILSNADVTSAEILIDSRGNIPAGDYRVKIIGHQGMCMDTAFIDVTVDVGTNDPALACQNFTRASLSGSCMLDLSVSMVLAGHTISCDGIEIDSIVALNRDGTLLNSIQINGRSDSIRLTDLSDFVNDSIIVEIHSTSQLTSNFCWGLVFIRDEASPELTCDTATTVSCLEYEGDLTDFIEVVDCDDSIRIRIDSFQTTTCENLSMQGIDSLMKQVIRHFTVFDSQNNFSTCTDTLNIRRIDLDLTNNDDGILDLGGFEPPLHYITSNRLDDLSDTTAFTCPLDTTIADFDNDGIPDPVDTVFQNGTVFIGAGIPIIDTTINSNNIRSELHPSNYILPHPSVMALSNSCNIWVTFSDTKFPLVGCVRKVVRTWVINENSCHGLTQLTFDQVIEVIDEAGPNLEIPADMTVSTNTINCTAQVQIPAPIALSDACQAIGSDLSVVVTARNGQYLSSISSRDGNYSLTTGGTLELPLGNDTILFQAYDHCLNVTTDTLFITVIDGQPPLMICKKFSVASLSNHGEITVPVASINESSFDDCHLAHLCGIRDIDLNRFLGLQSDSIGGRLGDGTWYVPLDSINDLCQNNYQASGTLNGVEYIIESDLCVEQFTYCCDDANSTDTIYVVGTDDAGNSNVCIVELTIQNKRQPTVHCPPDLTVSCQYDFTTDDDFSIFGNIVSEGNQRNILFPSNQFLNIETGKSATDGVYFGNCEIDLDVVVQDNREACGTGQLIRSFTFTSDNTSTVCRQTITFQRAEKIQPAEIVRPANIDTTGCFSVSDFIPDIIGTPTTVSTLCTAIGYSYSDRVVHFSNTTGACYKILRKWTVLDWCEDNAAIIDEWIQTISVTNDQLPEFVRDQCSEIVVETENCDSSEISINNLVIDDCSNIANLNWEVHIDLQSDGTVDTIIEIGVFDIEISNDTSIATLNTTLPIGVHRLNWQVGNECGLINSCISLLRVRNPNPPNAICKKSITTRISASEDGLIYANQYNLKSNDPKCRHMVLIYSFDPDAITPSKVITCDVDSNEIIVLNDNEIMDTFPVYVHNVEVFDGDTTLISFSECDVELILQDFDGNCDDSQSNKVKELSIFGRISSQLGETMPDVSVNLRSHTNASSNKTIFTGNDGSYDFGSLAGEQEYTVRPYFNDNILKGVSTLDLVYIQRHILGLDELDNPYNILAADVNNDQRISAIDLIELRKVLLQFEDSFKNNTSYRFVDANFDMSKSTEILSTSFPEERKIPNLNESTNVEFIGVKVGDVNGKSIYESTTRGYSKGRLFVQDRTFKQNEKFEVSLNLDRYKFIKGFQMSIQFDPEILSFEGFDSELEDLAQSSFGYSRIGQGIVHISWINSKKDIQPVSNYLTLKFNAKQSAKLSDVLALNDERLKAEVYTSNDEVIYTNLEYIPSDADDIQEELVVYQNNPNPFQSHTMLSFYLKKKQKVSIEIHDVIGRKLYESSDIYRSGFHSVEVNDSDFNVSSGILIYTISTAESKVSKEMIKIQN